MTATTKGQADLRDLAQRVQDLPAELYDMVLEYTFAADEDRIVITDSYKPSKLLHVNRATRDLFAKNYYICTRFFIPVWEHLRTIDRFVTSLSIDHVNLLAGSMSTPLRAVEGESITSHERRARYFVAREIYCNI